MSPEKALPWRRTARRACIYVSWSTRSPVHITWRGRPVAWQQRQRVKDVAFVIVALPCHSSFYLVKYRIKVGDHSKPTSNKSVDCVLCSLIAGLPTAGYGVGFSRSGLTWVAVSLLLTCELNFLHSQKNVARHFVWFWQTGFLQHRRPLHAHRCVICLSDARLFWCVHITTTNVIITS